MPFAQMAVERVLNSLPEGVLIALGAWMLLRMMGRQNSGTRFAVWFIALASVVALPLLSGLGSPAHALSALMPRTHPELSVPASWAVAFFVLWIAIAAAALARVIAGIWQVRQIRRGCTEVSPAGLDPELRSLLADTNRPVRLLVSDKARVPAALGFRNPAIVLPAWTLDELTVAALRPILIHELAHLRRRDDWTNLLQKTIRALLFFHPAVWWIDARLSLEREMACDDAVLAATGNPRAYAGCLIGLLEKGCARRGWSMAQAAVARARDASVRIARILHIGPTVTTRIGRVALGATAALALGCTGIALCAPQFVAFVPMQSPATAHLGQKPFDTLSDTAFRPLPSAVVPTAFHPAEHSAAVHAAIQTRLVRRSSVRQASLTQKRTAPNPAVLARFMATMNQQAAAPVVVIFRSTGLVSPGPAQLRTTSEPPVSNLRTLQSSENPALQIRIVQIVDPATGIPMQVLQIMLVLPQQPGSPSQSI